MKREGMTARTREIIIDGGWWRWLAVIGALWLISKAINPHSWRIQTHPEGPAVSLVEQRWWGFGRTEHNPIRFRNGDRGWEIRQDNRWTSLDVWDSRWDQLFGIEPESDPYDDRDF